MRLQVRSDITLEMKMVKPVGMPVATSSRFISNTQPVSEETQKDAKVKAPGQMAKALIQTERDLMQLSDAGSSLPSNIQGKVTSALARGLSLDMILPLQHTPEPEESVEGETEAIEPAVETEVLDAETTAATDSSAEQILETIITTTLVEVDSADSDIDALLSAQSEDSDQTI